MKFSRPVDNFSRKMGMKKKEKILEKRKKFSIVETTHRTTSIFQCAAEDCFCPVVVGKSHQLQLLLERISQIITARRR